METRVDAQQVEVPPEPLHSPARIMPPAVGCEPLVHAAVQATPLLAETLKQFWTVPIRLAFFSVSTKNHYYWRMDDFHVSQLTLGEADGGQEPLMALLRLSDAACSSLLDKTLGARQTAGKAFSFKQLSPLEATILNEFSRDVLAGFMKTLIRKPERAGKADAVHFIWMMQLESGASGLGDVGKIVLSVPSSAIRTGGQSAASTEPIADEFFYHVEAPATIRLGSTRIALSDLGQLEPDDLVVLEDSQAGVMGLVEPESGEVLPFPVEIQQKKRLTIPYTQEFAMMETQESQQPSTVARQDLWDNLMIEVNAEFEPIRLPLKQLKQMSEGLVIEMGDLVHNQICLQVEGKTLARGELLIVGDKFGIRISKVEATAGSASPVQQAAADASAVSASQAMVPLEAASDAEPGAQVGAAEEENLDTFLNEEFDDTFDDEEDW